MLLALSSIAGPTWLPYLQDCLQHGRYCDVIFQCEDGVTVEAHKIVLASHYGIFIPFLSYLNDKLRFIAKTE